MMVLDPRHLSRPTCFDGTTEEKRRVAIPARRVCRSVDSRYGDIADEVVRRTTPYLPTDDPPDEEGKKAYLVLHSVIVCCIKNRPLRLVMETVSRDGREALRKLDAEYRPTYRSRQSPHLTSAGCDAEYIDKLSECQQVVRE